MNPVFKVTLKIISNILTIVMVVFAILLVGLKLVGLQPYVVLSGSMESVYPTGSLVYVKDVDPATLEVNDIITFQMSGDVIATHRIVELVPDENNPDSYSFRTKGDENEIVDGSLVSPDDVVGTPVFCIPMLGYLASYIMEPPGKYIAITVAVSILLLEVIISILLDDKNDKKAEQAKQKGE